MSAERSTFRGNQKIQKMPSSIFDLEYFKKLYSKLVAISNDGARYENENYVLQPNQTEEEFQKMKGETFDLYKVTIIILGSKGERIVSHNENIFDVKNLPDEITQILFDNSLSYRNKVQQNPQNMFRIIYDFTKPSIFDFRTKPSVNINNSSIDISGQNETWVNGVYEQLISSIKERKTKRSWLYANYIYEILMLTLIIPLSILNLHMLSDLLAIPTLNLPSIIEVGLYIYMFILFLWIFRGIFNYSRWLFPYTELQYGIKKTVLAHRVFLFGLITSIIYSLIQAIIKIFINNI
ncbi:MAG: hypothetical protein KJN64_08070 [Ignavibacteria bacterium]|nr:hypothetical protein [Ignavibacteria bacterium]NNL22361.1 hypothetical protein [Ignavibacteriaceae bacterium]